MVLGYNRAHRLITGNKTIGEDLASCGPAIGPVEAHNIMHVPLQLFKLSGNYFFGQSLNE